MDDRSKQVARYRALRKEILAGLGARDPLSHKDYLTARRRQVHELRTLHRALSRELSGSEPPKNEASRASLERARRVGRHVERVARVFMSKKAYDLYVGPALADISYEYAEAVDAGRPWLARWYLARGFVWLVRPWAWASIFAKVAAWLGRLN